MGIQQCPNPRRRRMESSVHHPRRTIRTNSYVFRTLQLIIKGLVLVYIDDILIYGGKDIQEHRTIVRKVLELLRSHHLYLKPEKCDFEQTKVEYLGMIIGENTVAMDPIKVQAVTKWPIP